MDRVPKDLILHIASYLDISSICALSRICHYFCSIISTEEHWKSRVDDFFRKLPEIARDYFPLNQISYKEYYKEKIWPIYDGILYPFFFIHCFQYWLSKTRSTEVIFISTACDKFLDWSSNISPTKRN